MDFAQQLKSQIDIVQVASDYGLRLRRFGNRYSALCPFHNEKTPSFSIYSDHQFFKCFGCDAKGDVFSFVMMLENLTFYEALRKLADQHGIPMPKQSLASDEESRARASLYEMHEIAAAHFRSNLAGPNGASTRAYLADRGVSPDSIEQFGLGFSDRSGRALARVLDQRGFKPDQLENSGLVARRDDGSFYDRFRNRLMFPIQNESGKVIAFGGRALDPEENAKYINSIETKIYRKSNVLYNLNRARDRAMKADRMVLVEGYMDVIGAVQAGVTEAAAPCGTALTTEQIRALKRYSQNLYLNFDPDSAGEKAAERSIRLLLEENVRVRVVELEEGLDPDEYCKKFGAEAYQQRVAGAKSYFYWLADRARARFNTREPQGRIDAFQFLLPSINALNEQIERVTVANDLASYLGVAPGVVLEHFRKAAADRATRGPAPKQDATRATDRILLPLLLRSEEARKELTDRLRGLPFLRHDPAGPIYETVIAMQDAGETIDFNSVHARLTPALQERLAAIVLDAGESGVEEGLACIDALRRNDRANLRRELKAKIQTAEREGRIQDALDLMRQLAQVEGSDEAED